jgi:phosphoribosylanthranilate isomerase
MWIKICANTTLEDAQLAADLGADAVGFVFAPSKRRVTPEQVARITPHLPVTVERVGVFDSLDPEVIAEAARTAGLDAVQLHGGVSANLARSLHEIFAGQIKIIQTIHWQVDADGANAADSAAATLIARQLGEISREGIVDRVLIDSRVGTASGGTGVPFDWAKARATLTQNAGHLKLIVAGGLRPENVEEAIGRLAPWGVDVASGVEAEPGKKSREKLAAFIKNARP